MEALSDHFFIFLLKTGQPFQNFQHNRNEQNSANGKFVWVVHKFIYGFYLLSSINENTKFDLWNIMMFGINHIILLPHHTHI